VPIFTEFMAEAAKPWPKAEFKAPKTAKFAMVRGIREAFRPGTEPQVRVQAVPAGPQPYSQVWPDGKITGAPAPPPPPQKKQDDMTGLY
jgi:penicillin-binding protein 1A